MKCIVVASFVVSQAAQSRKLKCIALVVRPHAVAGSGAGGLCSRVGESILIVFTISVMSGLKAFEVFLD